MKFFEWIYGLKDFYGEALFNLLKGWDDSNFAFNQDYFQFDVILGVTILIAIVFFILYYYIVNHPRFNSWWSWLIVLAWVAISGYLYGHGVVSAYIKQGLVPPSLASEIGASNARAFGLYELILAALIFLILTFAFKRWSRNCRYSPWPLLRKRRQSS